MTAFKKQFNWLGLCRLTNLNSYNLGSNKAFSL